MGSPGAGGNSGGREGSEVVDGNHGGGSGGNSDNSIGSKGDNDSEDSHVYGSHDPSEVGYHEIMVEGTIKLMVKVSDGGGGGISYEDSGVLMPITALLGPLSPSLNQLSHWPLGSSQSRHLDPQEDLFGLSGAIEVEVDRKRTPTLEKRVDVSCGMFCQQKVNAIILKEIFAHLSY